MQASLGVATQLTAAGHQISTTSPVAVQIFIIQGVGEGEGEGEGEW